jgi:Cu/Ag efflux protein CusF
MKSIFALFSIALLATSAAVAQSSSGSMSMPMKAGAMDTKSSTVMTNAVIQKVDAVNGQVLLKHGDITNLGMTAMTMGFPVADKKMLEPFKAGDKVRFHAELMEGKPTITKLEAAR